jgi:[ribosomal protein S5]-alanine N-acetyltransferase
MELRTERLRLVACSQAICRAILARDASVGALLAASLSDEWARSELVEMIDVYADDLAGDSSLVGWGPWLVLHAGDNVLIGDAGFLGKPSKSGLVEIGYGVSPAYSGRGYATEAARALIAWAFDHPEVARVRAQCFGQNPASRRILHKLGMEETVAKPGQQRFVITKARFELGLK